MDATDAGENATAALERAESRLAAAEEALADARRASEAGADERPTGGVTPSTDEPDRVDTTGDEPREPAS